MNCATHPEALATAFCRTCGKALCTDCRRTVQGVVYCEGHTVNTGYGAAAAESPAATTPAAGRSNPTLAFFLGLIPGVGAIYNEQYAKGLVHALLFGLLITIMDSHVSGGLHVLIGMAIPAFIFYMAFEAYHTAQRRNSGQFVDEFSSVFETSARSSTGGAIVMIVLGIVFLLNTLEIVRLRQLIRFWPVLLIALGVSMLYSRVTERAQSGVSYAPPSGNPPSANSSLPEASHDR
ncbi:MAG: DUF5668 domain-containing protein [Bryobacteraceae bacterium]